MGADVPEKGTTGKCRRPSARERICKTARELFYKRGIRGVGVEMIAAEAGTTKMSLYRNFSSKDELVAECLCAQEQEFWAWWDDTIKPYEGDPRRQIEALFAGLKEQTAAAYWSRGCQFANAAVELPDQDHPARAIILEHHREVRERLRELCRGMNARRPEALADALLLVMVGGYMSCLVFETAEVASTADEAVRTLLSSELGAPGD